MINTNLLKSTIVKNGLTIEKVAKKMDVNQSTLSRKINGISDFYCHEIIDICKILKIANPMPIFFDGELAEMQESKN